MAKISTYPILSTPTINDMLIGTDVENLNETKNFLIGDIASLIIGGDYVPYVGAALDVDLGVHTITGAGYIVNGGLSTQFLKADGSLDSTVYQPAGNYITQLSGEATASGPGNASVTLSNSAVIGKVLTGLTITGDAIVATDSILTAFGKVQNQINTLVGGVQYKGTWNAATNTPTLQSSVGVQGNYYVVSVAGNTNLNGITDWKLGDWAIFNGSAWEKVDNTDAVISVNGLTGAVVLTTTNIAEGTNLYYTDLRARSSISLTTIGSSGAATYNYTTGIFNIPEYTLSGLGGVPLTRQLTINGTAFDLSADRSWSVGTVTSIATTGPLTGGTITGSGTIGITQAGVSSDGYLSSTDWNTFNNKQNAITDPVTGTGTPNTLPMWGSTTSLVNSPLSYAADTFNFQYNSTTGGTVNFTNIGLTAYTYSIQMNNFGSPRSTVHSYTDGLIIQSIAATQVSRMFANGNMILGTGAVDNGYKLELSGTFALRASASASVATQIPVFIADPSSNTRELVTRTPAQLIVDGGGIAGTLATGQVAFGTAANTVGGDNGLFWDNTNKRLGVRTNTPNNSLQISIGNFSLSNRNSGSTPATGTQKLILGGNASNGVGGEIGWFVENTFVGDIAQITALATNFGGNSAGALIFRTNTANDTTPTEKWRITSAGILQSNGAQTIQTSTGNLTLATAAGNGNIVLSPNGTGKVGIGINAPLLKLDVLGNVGDTSTIGGVTIEEVTLFRPSSFVGGIRTGFSTGGNAFIYSANSGSSLNFGTRAAPNNNINLTIASTGNVGINTTTDAGFRLDVNGTTRLNGLSTIQGTTASDTAPLGSELATTGSGTNWTGTSFATGYTHTIGSTDALTTTLAAVVSTFYQITYTVTGRTTGSFVINYGGTSSPALTATGAFGPRATSTATLEIVPTTDFNGTIVLSVRTIGLSSATVTFNASGGTAINEIRVSAINTTFFMGRNAGIRNTTAISTTFVGSSAGASNTTGSNGTFVGRGAGQSNTTGVSNTFVGVEAGLNNTTGGSNSFFGVSSGASNTTGMFNAFFGQASGLNNTTGNLNSFFGQAVGLANTTGGSNSFFGASSGFSNTTGASNSFFGISAGQNNTTASFNSFFGENAGLANTTGSNNVAFGRNSGRWAGAGTTAMTSVNNSIYLGYQTRGLNATGSTNEIVIGYDVVGLGSNTTVLGNTSTTHGRWYGNLLVGTSTNAGFALDVNGTARVQNTLDLTNPTTSGVLLNIGPTTLVSGMEFRNNGVTNRTTFNGYSNSITVFRLDPANGMVIGGGTINSSAILQADSTTRGFLPPRMTAAQRTAIASPAEGLIVYQTDSVIGLYIYANATWRSLAMV